MKKTPPEQPDPERHPSPFQQLGCLRIVRGSIMLVCVKYRGVELVLSSGISLQIPTAEIRRLAFPSNQLFADCLELGAHFPSLKFVFKVMKDFTPLWLDSWNDSSTPPPRLPRPRKPPADKATSEAAENGPAPQAADQTPVFLPLPPVLPLYPSSRSGGSGR